jgi:RNA polymerase sigma factor (sigma-70 family)
MGNVHGSDRETQKRLDAAYRAKRKEYVGWVTREIRNVADAEDVVQSAFASALNRLDALSTVENLGAWLFASIKNRVVDAWRAKARRWESGERDVSAETLAEIAQATGLDPADALESEALLDALQAAIEALPAEQASVLRAQALEGESFASISRRTGISEDTLASRKRYAIAAIAKALRAWIED